MTGKAIALPLPTDNPVGQTPTTDGSPGHVEDHDKIREILAVLVNGFVPDKLGDLSDVNTDNVGDGVGAGYVLVWDGGKFLPVNLPKPVTGALVSGATLRLQYPDGSFTDVLLPVNTGPSGAPGAVGAAGRGIASLAFADVTIGANTERHLTVTYSDAPNTPVDLGAVPRGLPGSNGADGRSLTSAAVNPAGRLILTYSDRSTVDAGNVVGPAGVGSFADSFRGMYSATTTYAKNDIVSNGGDTYFSRIDNNTGNTPVPDQTSAQWAILALNGAKGDAGAQGPIGATPALSVGTVTTLDPDGSAAATFTGTPAAPVLNLSLPRGSTGLKGDRGVDGAAGVAGQAGVPGRGISALTLSSTNALSVTYDDGTTTSVGSIATVKGDPGATGPAGAAGTNGTNGTNGAPGAAAQLTAGTTTTLAPGSSAAATITGTAPNYVLNLSLPAGNDGAPGSVGATGPAGPDSWATPVVWSSTTTYVATAPRSVVTYLGQTYVALKANTNSAPGVDATAWRLVAAKGSDGATGGAAKAIYLVPAGDIDTANAFGIDVPFSLPALGAIDYDIMFTFLNVSTASLNAPTVSVAVTNAGSSQFSSWAVTGTSIQNGSVTARQIVRVGNGGNQVIGVSGTPTAASGVTYFSLRGIIHNRDSTASTVKFLVGNSSGSLKILAGSYIRSSVVV